MHKHLLEIVINYIPRYLQIFYSFYTVKNVYVYIGYGKLFKLACKKSDLILVDWLLDSFLEIHAKDPLHMEMRIACRYGKIDIVKLLIERGAKDLFMASRQAGKSGNTEIINLLCQMEQEDIYWLLRGAFEGGNLDVVRMLGGSGYERFLDSACRGGNMELVNIAMKTHQEWNKGLKGACLGGHMDIVKLMIEKGANEWEECFIYACKGGNMDIVKLIMEKELIIEKRLSESCKNLAIFNACKGGNVEIVKLLLDTNSVWFEQGFNEACRKGYADIAKLMINKVTHFGRAFNNACEEGQIDIIKFLVDSTGIIPRSKEYFDIFALKYLEKLRNERK